MQRQNMIFLFFIAFLLLIFVGYLFVIGEQKDSRKSANNSGLEKEEVLEECEFSKSYNLLLVTESADEEYVFLTLKEYEVDDVNTIKVKKDVMPSLKKGNYYRFNFTINKKIHNDIDEIFSSSNLINVEDHGKIIDFSSEICDTHLIEE